MVAAYCCRILEERDGERRGEVTQKYSKNFKELQSISKLIEITRNNETSA